MVTEYKVIKPFGTLKVGDVLKLDGDIFKFENLKNEDGRYIVVKLHRPCI